MRHQYKALGNTFTAHVQSLLEKGCVIVLPISAIEEFNLKINFTTYAWWAPKSGKPEGRFCIDPTNAPKGYIGLNTPETLDIAIDKYLPTNLPTIHSLITNQTLSVASKFQCSISDLTLYKSDINSAFYTTIINPKDAPLGGVRISESEFMIHISGSFGLNSQPLVFNLLGRNFNYKINQVISGSADTYIDDTCGSTIDHLVDYDLQQIKNTSFSILGENSINEKKVEKGKSLVWIGWNVNVVTSSIRPSDKAIRKLFHTFFVSLTDNFQSMKFKLRQKLHSRVERYSQGIIGTRPFINVFIKLLQQQNNHPDALLRMDSSTKQAILFWRIIIIILISNPELLSTPFEHFRLSNKNEFTLEFITDSFDSIGIQCLNNEGTPICCTSYPFPFQAMESDYQNFREFTAVILALFIAKRHCNLPRGSYLKLISDNASSISWLMKNKTKSSYAERAFLLYTWSTITTGYTFNNISHSPGSGDVIRDSDILSRNPHYRPLKCQYINLNEDKDLLELISFCDPFKNSSDIINITIEAIKLTTSIFS